MYGPSLSYALSSTAIEVTLVFFFFNDTATTEIYTLSLHDALPISRTSGLRRRERVASRFPASAIARSASTSLPRPDRKSTRLNSSHLVISYAVFCLKKKHPLRAAADAAVLRRDATGRDGQRRATSL